YSLAWVPLGAQGALALGSPRFRHVGRVLLALPRPGGTWRVVAEASGPQVGSYFGGSLLSLDPDGDGRAEVLLVGTPLFHGGGGGGRVDLCHLRGQ
ncbi:integrin alpha-L-like, partial [Corapipo altera]|uniref:integrin alpha-L-like n=1 Tax=Corapipo altera TaxID=415028 RepID=UPI000FD63FBB